MGLLANWLQWHRSRAHMRAAFNRMGLEVNYNPLHITTYHNHAGAKYYVWGLYRVNFRDGNEVTARYQINGEDAFNTGTAMAQYEAPSCACRSSARRRDSHPGAFPPGDHNLHAARRLERARPGAGPCCNHDARFAGATCTTTAPRRQASGRAPRGSLTRLECITFSFWSAP
jgi:hypothetical protein